MDNMIIQRSKKFEGFILIIILMVALYLNFLPHFHYPYPIHLDEWLRLGQSKAIVEAHSVTYIDPFHGKDIVTFSSDPETSFHLFWAMFHQISSIPWLTIYKFFPSVIFAITILSVYILARREGFGWQAALISSLTPTTVGILGPRFLVPVSLGLAYIFLILFMIFYFKNVESYVIVFIFMIFLLTMHAVTAVGIILIVGPYLLLTIRDNYKGSLIRIAIFIIPFLAPFLWAFRQLIPTVKDYLSPKPLLTFVEVPVIFDVFGYMPILLGLIGTFYLVLKGGKRNYGFVFGFLFLLITLAVSYSLGYGTPMLYYRGLLYMIVMISVIGGAGLMALQNIRLQIKLGIPVITQNVGNILCVILIIITLVLCIPVRINTPYYHMIDENDYEAFVWIRDNINNTYEKAILDPWKGIPFSVIAEKPVYTAIRGYAKPSDNEANAFLSNECLDTTFLRENGISIVYTLQECRNRDLIMVREHVYLLNKEED